MSSTTTAKPSIETKAYDNFCRKFEKGEFGAQRFGRAFYDAFKLHKLNDQASLNNIYAKDGDHAKNSIKAIFDFH